MTVNPERYIVPGAPVVMLTPTMCRFLVGYTDMLEVYQRYRGANDQVDACVAAIRAVDKHARPDATGTGSAPGTPPANHAEPAARWVTTGQAATRLGITERAVRKRCTAGRILGARLSGGRWQIPADSLTTL
ncbi:helix-turn-helix domain-containing protein [Microbacterium sp.]|uniref:helix-turn-helix domain-containing protein n=1 Tax=Microbacterium sp. TaxID=51671 RepID=UPI0039E34434